MMGSCGTKKAYYAQKNEHHFNCVLLEVLILDVSASFDHLSLLSIQDEVV